MFEKLKLTLAHFFAKRMYLKHDMEPIVFNKIISGAIDFFIILPEDDSDFHFSLELIHYLYANNKAVTIFTMKHKYSLIPEKEKYKSILFSAFEKNRLNLPKKELVKRLKTQKYDVTLDLNRKGNIFYGAVANIVNSQVKISFIKEGMEAYYNFLYTDKQNSPEISFRNLINYLQMF